MSFCQLYSIHGNVKKECVPLLWAHLHSKTFETYIQN